MKAGAFAQAVTNDNPSCLDAGGSFAQGDVTMRDCSKDRAGFDRVLIAVAATFLAVSATSALAQSDAPRASAAELAIEAAIPFPQPANVPPPTAADFKIESTASVPDTAKIAEPKAAEKATDNATEPTTTAKAADPKPADVVTAPPADTKPNDAPNSDTATAPVAAPPAAATATAPPAAEPVKAASNVPPADQPVADKLRDMLGAKSLRYIDRKGERTAVEKFYSAREYAPVWTQAGTL